MGPTESMKITSCSGETSREVLNGFQPWALRTTLRTTLPTSRFYQSPSQRCGRKHQTLSRNLSAWVASKAHPGTHSRGLTPSRQFTVVPEAHSRHFHWPLSEASPHLSLRRALRLVPPGEVMPVKKSDLLSALQRPYRFRVTIREGCCRDLDAHWLSCGVALWQVHRIFCTTVASRFH